MSEIKFFPGGIRYIVQRKVPDFFGCYLSFTWHPLFHAPIEEYKLSPDYEVIEEKV